MTDEADTPKRKQFSWWLPTKLGERFLRHVEKLGPKVRQREVAERAIESYLDAAERRPSES